MQRSWQRLVPSLRAGRRCRTALEELWLTSALSHPPHLGNRYPNLQDCPRVINISRITSEYAADHPVL
jgi:hypothetical protein